MNTGIVGYGKEGKLRHRVLEELSGHKVVHVCDPLPVSGNFRTAKDPGDVISDPEVDAVFICTPNNLISDLTIVPWTQASTCSRKTPREYPPARCWT